MPTTIEHHPQTALKECDPLALANLLAEPMRIVQLLAPKPDDGALMYGLDNRGQVWVMLHQPDGFPAWAMLSAGLPAPLPDDEGSQA